MLNHTKLIQIIIKVDWYCEGYPVSLKSVFECQPILMIYKNSRRIIDLFIIMDRTNVRCWFLDETWTYMGTKLYWLSIKEYINIKVRNEI